MDNAVAGEQNGKTVLAPDGPSYKAIVLDQRRSGDTVEPFAISLETAAKLIDYAKAGLPIVMTVSYTHLDVYKRQAVFVAHAAQGDVLTVRIVKLMKNFAFGKIEEIITPSPHRIEQDCPVSSRCGGCVYRLSLIHI